MEILLIFILILIIISPILLIKFMYWLADKNNEYLKDETLEDSVNSWINWRH